MNFSRSSPLSKTSSDRTTSQSICNHFPPRHLSRNQPLSAFRHPLDSHEVSSGCCPLTCFIDPPCTTSRPLSSSPAPTSSAFTLWSRSHHIFGRPWLGIQFPLNDGVRRATICCIVELKPDRAAHFTPHRERGAWHEVSAQRVHASSIRVGSTVTALILLWERAFGGLIFLAPLFVFVFIFFYFSLNATPSEPSHPTCSDIPLTRACRYLPNRQHGSRRCCLPGQAGRTG